MSFVTTRLYGRLGNQCYQIANTIAVATRNRVPFLIPQVPLDGHPAYFTHFPVFVPAFHNIKYTFTEPRPPFTYRPIIYSPNMCLDGYWQSFEYFNDCRDKILSEFRFAYSKLDAVSIHVRRGDYLNYGDAFPVTAESYFEEAIKMFPGRTFIVFSDDIPWCKEFFSKFTNNKILYSENRTPVQDMEIMSCCEHNITTNSSFSIFAAWLNRNKNKIVVAPKRQIKDANTHLIPKEWVRI